MASTRTMILRINVGGNIREIVVQREKQEPVKCSHCSKMFRSLKSLFGHMRCHPERHYRGMRPPEGSQPLTVVDKADRLGLVRYLPPGWGVKAKRSSVAAMEDLLGGAYILMLLSTGIHRYGGSTSHPRKRQEESGEAEAAKRYKCRALGGHTSSAHSKPHHGVVEREHQQDLRQGVPQRAGSDTSVSKPASELSRHICKTCDKAFPSGQALGGHMRLHWVGPSHPPLSLTTYLPGQGQGQPAMVTSDGADPTAEATRPVLDFDLNQLPLLPLDDDTQEQTRIITDQ